jgi:uncharacterized low-complexity protein
MESKKSMLAGSLIASAILGLSNLGANASTLTTYSALGSGAEIRSELLNIAPSNSNRIELTCGAKDSTKAGHGKAKDGKCGEGKCGDHKKDAKTGEHKTEVKDAKEAKPVEHKKDEKSPK